MYKQQFEEKTGKVSLENLIIAFPLLKKQQLILWNFFQLGYAAHHKSLLCILTSIEKKPNEFNVPELTLQAAHPPR